MVSDPAIWILLVACVLSCYFAACNIALKTFSRPRLLEQLEHRGQADRLDPFLEHRRKLLLITGVLHTGLSLAVLLAVLSYVERSGLQDHTWAVYLIAFVVAGLLVSLLTVAVPLSIARYHREKLLARSIPLLNACLLVLGPLAGALHAVDPVVRRLLGADADPNAETDLSDEILSVVEQHDNHGAVDERQKEMLEAIVEFPSTTAGQIMTPRTDVCGIEINASLDEIRATIGRDRHSRIPVFDDNLDQIIGILYAKDLIQFIGSDQPFELRSILRDAMMVPESKPLRELLAEFKARKVHLAIVLDEYGGTAGLVTIEDILEEIVGEIHDEYEPTDDTPHIRRSEDGQAADVDARVYIDDLNDELDLDLPEDKDYDTVGGFVFSTLGHIPDVGEQFEYHHARFTVTGAQRTKVTSVRIEMLKPHNSRQPHTQHS